MKEIANMEIEFVNICQEFKKLPKYWGIIPSKDVIK